MTNMAKTQKELNALKEEVVTLNEKFRELTEEELKKLSGGGNASFNVEDWNGYAEPENSK